MTNIKNNSNTFFTSDIHFSHRNIILYQNRPYKDVEEMNEQIILNWNSIVKPSSTVWNLGDFSFQSLNDFKRTLKRLNGKINLILGNHDKLIIENQEELLKEGLLESIQNYKKIKVEGQNIVLSHYAFRVWDGSHKGHWMLYGHSHNSLPPHGKSFDVGVDSTVITTEYRPISFEEVKKFMDKQSVAVIDHHGANKTP